MTPQWLGKCSLSGSDSESLEIFTVVSPLQYSPLPVVLSEFQDDQALLFPQKAGSFSVTLISDCQILNECYAVVFTLNKKKRSSACCPCWCNWKKKKTRHVCLYRLFKECINTRILLLLTLYDHTRFNQVCTNFSKSNHRTFNDRMMTKWSLADAAIFGQCLSIKMHCHNTIF